MDRKKANEVSKIVKQLQYVEENLNELNERNKSKSRSITGSGYGLAYEELKEALDRKLEKLGVKLTNLM